MDDVLRRETHEAHHAYALEELSVGMTSSYLHTITEADVHAFAAVTGDFNPLHLDEDFARATRFKGRIVHGMLTASYFSTILAILPGPGTIYLSQSLFFRAPVRIGDAVEAQVTVVEIIAEKRRARLKTVGRVGDTVVVDGEAMVMIPPRA
jgi:3-hydroxybutyryl-CoA dehydratase